MKVNLNNIDQKYINIYRLIFCILEWTSLIIMIVMTFISFNGSLYSTFTFQSNLLVALWLTITLIFYKRDDKPKLLNPGVRGAITLYITVTFLVYAFILAPSSDSPPQGINLFTTLMVHYLIPIAMIIDWLITEANNQYKWTYLLYWMIYPVAYLVYSLILGAFNIYIYGFFDVTKIGILGLLFVIIGLTFLFLLLGCLYIFINRKLLNKFK